ncbi:MAG TPA: hypothetical protein VMF65_14010 [Acidimicrobiales bacterium]|nr:hypothetical protein [Acidimicrobiales bacterium]
MGRLLPHERRPHKLVNGGTVDGSDPSRAKDEAADVYPQPSAHVVANPAIDVVTANGPNTARSTPLTSSSLLEWSGEQVAAYHDSVQLDGPANVVWAGGRVPRWLGLGRDFTERWVHQAQIREAVGRPRAHDRYLPTVLSVFVWAYPHQYKPDADTGVRVNIDFGEELRWHLVRRESN